MLRPTNLIGCLLDAALDIALHVHPEEITVDAGLVGGEPGERLRVEPRSVARALLANHLRDAACNPDGPVAAYPYPTFDALAALAGKPVPEEPGDLDADADDMPDVLLLDRKRRAACAISVRYGWQPEAAREALDRLMALMWADMAQPPARAGLEMIALIFVHETGFGEIIRDTDRSVDDWIGANYGPFKGRDRIGIPMMPRLLRTGKHSPLDGTMLSKIDGVGRPTGFAAYAIVYERDRP